VDSPGHCFARPPSLRGTKRGDCFFCLFPQRRERVEQRSAFGMSSHETIIKPRPTIAFLKPQSPFTLYSKTRWVSYLIVYTVSTFIPDCLLINCTCLAISSSHNPFELSHSRPSLNITLPNAFC